MKYLTVQPDSKYFEWQLLVLHNNMKELGMFHDSITIIGYDHQPALWAMQYKKKYPEQVFLIQDTRQNRNYIPSIRPHLLKKFFYMYPDVLTNHNWMFHDSDILFSKKLDWDSVVTNPKTVYLSDTVSYIGAKYIQSKGEGLLNEMCSVVGIEPSTVIQNESNSGGAQYIFGKGVSIDSTFFDIIEGQSDKLYRLMINTSGKYNPEHPIQSWTADMWVLLWNIWKAGYETKVVSAMNFSWPNDNKADFFTHNIFHNAGVSTNEKDLFYKGAFINKAPFGMDFSHVDKSKCSYKYVEMINRTSESMKK